MGKWIGVGTVLQVTMVTVGHGVAAVADLFGILGVTISLAVALLWARTTSENYGGAARGGAVVGGACALIGIAVSFALGDVPAMILALGAASSAVAGAGGGLLGHRLRPAAGEVA